MFYFRTCTSVPHIWQGHITEVSIYPARYHDNLDSIKEGVNHKECTPQGQVLGLPKKQKSTKVQRKEPDAKVSRNSELYFLYILE